MNQISLICIISLLNIGLHTSHSFPRTYDLQFQKFMISKSCDKAHIGQVKIDKEEIGEKIKINARLELKKPLRQSSFMTFFIYEKSGSKWVKSMLSYEETGPDALKTCKGVPMCQSVLEKSNFPQEWNGELPPGNYTLKDYIFDKDKLPPVLPGGDFWKADLKTYVKKNGKFLCGGEGFMKVLKN